MESTTQSVPNPMMARGRGVPHNPENLSPPSFRKLDTDFYFLSSSSPTLTPSGRGRPPLNDKQPEEPQKIKRTPTFKQIATAVKVANKVEEAKSKENFKPPIRIEDFPYPMNGSYREAAMMFIWVLALTYMFVLCILESAGVADRDELKTYWLVAVTVLVVACVLRVLLFSYLDTVRRRDERRPRREALLAVKNDHHRRMRTAWMQGRTPDRLRRPPTFSGDTPIMSSVIADTLRERERRNAAAREEGVCPFGETMKKRHFWLKNHFLNTASYGATPRSVQEDKTKWDETIQVNPSAFMRYHVEGLLNNVVNRLSAIIHSNPEDTVLTVNANQATSSILKSLPWEIGDQLLIYSVEYDATLNAANWLRLHEGVETITIELTLPMTDDQILDKTKAFLEKSKNSEAGLPKLANFCHVTSKTAYIFPAKRMVSLFHFYGIPVIVDGAQAPGHLDLNVNDIGADWYIGTIHKWMYSCQGAAFLVTRSDRKYCTTPLDVSRYSGRDYKTEFMKSYGVHDWSTWLAIEAAFDFVDITCGGWDNVRGYCRKLACSVVQRFGSSWGGKVQQLSVSHFGNLPIISLPEGSPVTQILTVGAMTNNPPISAFFLNSFDGTLRAVRCSCQIHTSLDDYIKLEHYVKGTKPNGSKSRLCPCFPSREEQPKIPASQKLT
eukprot:TRINITY_DN1134_c10_g1_i1.p1 TRINITY_DN1134_c10_g1~~TRINITY_DN1134_c10_g1_i1.p1  ORF type:complete len:666 (+),score=81.17 TRINITY_DN1134_c10_g1_i1:132-2129(+)